MFQLTPSALRALLIAGAIVLLLGTFHAGRTYESQTPELSLQSGANIKTGLSDEQWKAAVVLKLDAVSQSNANLQSKWEAFRKTEWIYDIGIYDYYHEFSQTHTDSILQFIFQNLGTTDKYYVEFGTEDGSQTNTRWLREKQGWTGLLMDGGHDKPEINLHKEMMYKSNIMELFKKYHVPELPKTFDLLSVDIDYNTYWVWKAIDHKVYSPRVIVAEYNSDWSPSVDSPMLSTMDCETCMWDGTEYQGANAQAMWKLGRDKGYTMVYMETHRVNMYFIRTDLLGGQEIADEFFPFKRVFRWGALNQHPETQKQPVTVNGLEG